MEIQILSKDVLIDLLENNQIPKNTNIISIRDYNDDCILDDCETVLNLAFNDRLEGDVHTFTHTQAQQIHDFAIKTYNQNKNLIVQCRGGVSRSAACAAAISVGLNEAIHASVSPTSDEIWASPLYTPNEYVYALLASTFGVNFSDEELQVLIQKNIDAYVAQKLK